MLLEPGKLEFNNKRFVIEERGFDAQGTRDLLYFLVIELKLKEIKNQQRDISEEHCIHNRRAGGHGTFYAVNPSARSYLDDEPSFLRCTPHRFTGNTGWIKSYAHLGG